MAGGHGHESGHHGHESGGNSGGGVLSAFGAAGGPASQLTTAFCGFFTALFDSGGGGHHHGDHH